MEKHFGIIRPEWTVLICLKFKDGVTAKDIREITEQPGNTVSRAVNSLDQKGLITKQSDENDGRRTLLYITDQGAAIYHDIMRIFEEGEKKMTSCLSSTELKQLDTLLDKMCRHVLNWPEA